MKHIHKYIVFCYYGFLNPSVKKTKVVERCECGDEITRMATISEVNEIRKENNKRVESVKLLHKVYHKILENGKFKYRGYELQLVFEKLQKKHPEILSCHIDDDNFMNSFMFFVPIMSRDEYRTTSVFVVPQSGEPLNIVMSKSDVEDMIRVLKKLKGKFGRK